MIGNPIYGGAYAYGKTGVAAGYDGAGYGAKRRRKARDTWLALMPNMHEGYVGWEKAEAIRRMVSDNIPTSRHHGAPKHGDALFAGLVRCRRCGHKLTIRYSGAKHDIRRYSCARSWLDNGEPRCIAFGGLRDDDAIEEPLLRVVSPGAIAAAAAAEAEASERRDQEAAPYTADRAFRQYDAADPANRLVAGELEARWNRALVAVASVEAKIAGHDLAVPQQAVVPASLASLAADLKSVWSAPATDARLKKRIVRTVIHEVVADIDDEAGEIVLVIHWMGGVHIELRLARRRRGRRNSTDADIIAAVRRLVLIASDDLIAGILNRNGLSIGNGNRWTRERVTSMRSNYRIPVHRPTPRRGRALFEPRQSRRAHRRRAEDAANHGGGRRDQRHPLASRWPLDLQPGRSHGPKGENARLAHQKAKPPHGTASGPTKPLRSNDIARWVL